LNFTQIASKLSFTSVHYFSKNFKIKTGMTPSQYNNSIL
ncbi:MAG: AraC family transcriptional regulator, partial [Clostridia bacterium]